MSLAMSFEHVTSPRALAALLLLAAPALGQGQVWVVDDGGGAGVDFTSIQAAVDVAADGDLVLVKAGTYSGFTINAKALTVIADTGAAVAFEFQPVVRVDNSTASQAVALRGLGVPYTGPTIVNWFRIAASGNAGPLWVEDCRTAALQHPPFSFASSSSVALLRCFAPPTPTYFFAHHTGLAVENSSVHCFDSHLEGTAVDASYPGGDGAELAGGFLFLSGSTIRGGSYPPCGTFTCQAFAGEAGLALLAGGHVEVLDTILDGGLGSTFGCCDPPYCGIHCGGGPVGPDVLFGGGTLNTMFEASRSFEVSSPIRAGQSATLTAQGNPGDFVVALYSFRQQHAFLPNIGTLLVPLAIGTETGFVVLGATGPTGSLVASVPFAPFPAGLEYLQIYLQAAFVTTQPVIIVGGGSLLVVLNQAF